MEEFFVLLPSCWPIGPQMNFRLNSVHFYKNIDQAAEATSLKGRWPLVELVLITVGGDRLWLWRCASPVTKRYAQETIAIEDEAKCSFLRDFKFVSA